MAGRGRLSGDWPEGGLPRVGVAEQDSRDLAWARLRRVLQLWAPLLEAVEERRERLAAMLELGRQIDQEPGSLERDRLQEQIEQLREQADGAMDRCRSFHREAREALLEAAAGQPGLVELYQKLACLHAPARTDPNHLKLEILQAREILLEAFRRKPEASACETLPDGRVRDGGSELLTVPEAARWLQVSPKTVYRMAQTGGIPHVRLGRSVRLRRSDLETWLARRSRIPRLR